MDYVRCCGVSGSVIIGKITPKVTTSTSAPGTITTIYDSLFYVLQTTIIPFDDETINESKSINKSLYLKFNGDNSESTTVLPVIETTTIYDNKHEINGETTTLDYVFDTKTTSSENNLINSDQIDRHSNQIDNVIMIYPNEMSGKPKTKPIDMPDEMNEMKIYDSEMRTNLHVIYPMSKTESIEKSTTELSTDASVTNSFSTTTELNNEVITEILSDENLFSTVSTEFVDSPLSTTELPINNLVATATTESIEPITKLSTINLLSTELPLLHFSSTKLSSNRLQDINQNNKRRYFTQNRRRRLEKSTIEPITSTTSIPVKIIKSRLRELYETAQEKQETISENVMVEATTRKVFKTRAQLFNAKKRSNFLRQNPEMEIVLDTEHKSNVKEMRTMLALLMNQTKLKKIPAILFDSNDVKRFDIVEKIVRNKIMQTLDLVSNRKNQTYHANSTIVKSKEEKITPSTASPVMHRQRYERRRNNVIEPRNLSRFSNSPVNAISTTSALMAKNNDTSTNVHIGRYIQKVRKRNKNEIYDRSTSSKSKVLAIRRGRKSKTTTTATPPSPKTKQKTQN